MSPIQLAAYLAEGYIPRKMYYQVTLGGFLSANSVEKRRPTLVVERRPSRLLSLRLIGGAVRTASHLLKLILYQVAA